MFTGPVTQEHVCMKHCYCTTSDLLAHVNRMSMYVQTKMMSTRTTIPRVIHVVPLPLLETDDRFFLLERVEDRFSGKTQLGCWEIKS